MIDTNLLRQRIAAGAADFVRELFGDRARAAGSGWRVGNHGSLVIEVKDGALVFFDHEQSIGGDAVTLWQRERGGTAGEALRAVAAWAGIGGGGTPHPLPTAAAAAPMRKQSPAAAPGGPRLPDDTTPGTEADWRALGALRCVSHFAPALAARLGTLHFGTVCGFRCWILTDERSLCMEARRMDGKLFPAVGGLGERKAHTLKGSVKSWPVGLAVRGFTPADFRAILAVEGGGDYLAALDFTHADKADCLPIAFLGAGTANEIHPEALPLLRGRRARFYPHHEPSGAGGKAVSKWAAQFAAIGARVDAFDFALLRKADGSPVKDLGDCTQIHPDDAGELEGLLP